MLAWYALYSSGTAMWLNPHYTHSKYNAGALKSAHALLTYALVRPLLLPAPVVLALLITEQQATTHGIVAGSMNTIGGDGNNSGTVGCIEHCLTV
jgi:hypothetical protein